MLAYLRLIRFVNLLLVAATLFLVRYCLILPAFETTSIITGDYPEHMSRLHFALLVAATLCVTAAGNIINDVFDVTTDAVNRPGRNLFEHTLRPAVGHRSFLILAATGSLLGLYLGVSVGKPAIGLLHLFASGSLWMYSSYYKRRLIIGNLIIALLSFLMVMIPGLFEPEFYPNISYLLVYACLAFLVSWAREIIKDMEDQEGDRSMDCNTIPIRFGIRAAKAISVSILILTGGAIGYVIHANFYDNTVVGWWNLLLIFELPLAGLVYLTVTAEGTKDFHYASVFAKVYLLLGILSMFPFWYYFLR